METAQTYYFYALQTDTRISCMLWKLHCESTSLCAASWDPSAILVWLILPSHAFKLTLEELKGFAVSLWIFRLVVLQSEWRGDVMWIATNPRGMPSTVIWKKWISLMVWIKCKPLSVVEKLVGRSILYMYLGTTEFLPLRPEEYHHPLNFSSLTFAVCVILV